ncbi:MAG: type II toxin-antitoxin system VapC family toxin [Pseudonocardia sp.]|jgi:predicted nucleic acid-binding protein
MTRPAEVVVPDASVLVDLLAGTERAQPARRRLRGTVMHAPAHLDAEVLSALGRLHRAGGLTASDIDLSLARLVAMPVIRHPVAELVLGSWARRDQLRLVDAVYVELATRLDAPLLTSDPRLARACPRAEAIRD